jgi:hypothetical protein
VWYRPHPFFWSRVRRRRGATGRSDQAAGPGAARGSGRDRRVDQCVPTRAGRSGAGRVRPDRAPPPAAARPHGRLLRAGVGAVRRCRLPGGAAATGGGAAPAGPAPPRRPAAAAGEVRAGPGPRPAGAGAAAGAVRRGCSAACHPRHPGRVVSGLAAGGGRWGHAGRGRHPR